MKQIAPLQQLKLCQGRGTQREQSLFRALKEDLVNFLLLTLFSISLLPPPSLLSFHHSLTSNLWRPC